MPAAPLVSVPELAALTARGPGPLLLDVRWRFGGPPGREAFRAGHLPGARFVDLDVDLAGPPGARGRHPLPDRAAFEAAMRGLGVSAARAVVVYDDSDGSSAARAWWLLDHHGHDDVRLLDGGYAAWVAAALPIEAGEPPPAPRGDFVAGPGRRPVLDADGAAAMAARGRLLDARAAERFRGEVEPVDPVAGHIPGAVSAPTAGNVGADGRLLPAARLRERFGALGVDGGDVGVYCGSGVTAAHEVLALELAGVRAALYPGSWSEWVADPGRPVARGE